MLRLRLSATEESRPRIIERLGELEGVHRLTAVANEADGDCVISADLTPAAADLVLKRVKELNFPEEQYVIVRQEVVAPQRAPGHTFRTDGDFAWAEVLGSARANSRPIGRYMLLMAVAGCIAAMGVVSSNQVLIVGAMAVSPDLLPICATSVALVGKRLRLALRAFGTLVIGMMLVMAVAAILAFLLHGAGILNGNSSNYLAALGPLVHTDYATIVVAVAAGIAGILSFETRAAAAVGVAISITTVPASAYFGVSCGLGTPYDGLQALVTLGVNVSLIILIGTLTLAIQRWVPTRS